MSSDVGHRCSSDPTLLCLWYRLAAIDPTWPLAWELPYAAGAALKKQKIKNIKKNNRWRDWQRGKKKEDTNCQIRNEMWYHYRPNSCQ